MSFPRYPTYRPSEVEWLIDVPAHWHVTRLKWHITRSDGGVWGDDPSGLGGTIVLRSTEQTVDGHWQIEDPAVRQLTAAEYGGSRLLEGDLLITKSSGSSRHIGKTTLATREIAAMNMCYSNFMQRVRLDASLLPKLVWYVFNSPVVRSQFDVLANSTTGLANLNGGIIGSVVLPVPDREEQAAITSFLDRETAKIDALVAEQRRLIDLLKEKWQAVISHAVTKGLNPDAPMKPSGVDWLGEVPAHWERTRIKYCLKGLIDTEHKTAPFYDDGEYLVVRTTNIRDGRLVLDGAKYTDAAGFREWTVRGTPRPGDIMFTREAPAGEACLVPEGVDLCMGQRTVLMQVDRALLDPTFGLWSLCGGLAGEFVTELSQGSTVVHFNMSDIKNIPVMLPPFGEQVEIAEYLVRQSDCFEGLTSEAERAIALLHERRTALISAAVTGQIDVRGIAAAEVA